MIGITITKDEGQFDSPYSIQVDGLNTDKMLELQTLLNQRVFRAPLPLPVYGTVVRADEDQIRAALVACPKLFSTKIPAIKFVRQLTQCDLKTAKDLVDSCSIVYDNRFPAGNGW